MFWSRYTANIFIQDPFWMHPPTNNPNSQNLNPISLFWACHTFLHPPTLCAFIELFHNTLHIPSSDRPRLSIHVSSCFFVFSTGVYFTMSFSYNKHFLLQCKKSLYLYAITGGRRVHKLFTDCSNQSVKTEGKKIRISFLQCLLKWRLTSSL